MTEIPEHLLKRSKERRAAIGGGDAGGDAGGETGGAAVEPEDATPRSAVEPAASTPPDAPTPATAATTTEPAPVPLRPEVEAYQRRRRIPFWAMPVLAFLPLWAYMFQATLEPPPDDVGGPLAHGGEVYQSCAACHAASGQGVGSFPALDTVVEDFPDFRDHMMWVRLGSQGWPADTYGATDKPKLGGMPPHPGLSDEDLAAVVLYERVQFGGSELGAEEDLEHIAEGEMTFADAGLGEESQEAGVTEDELGG